MDPRYGYLSWLLISVLGQKQTLHSEVTMSALPPKAGIAGRQETRRFDESWGFTRWWMGDHHWPLYPRCRLRGPSTVLSLSGLRRLCCDTER